MDIIDDVLEYIAAVGDAARYQALLEGPSVHVTPDDKAIINITLHDILLAILPEKCLLEVHIFWKNDFLLVCFNITSLCYY